MHAIKLLFKTLQLHAKHSFRCFSLILSLLGKLKYLSLCEPIILVCGTLDLKLSFFQEKESEKESESNEDDEDKNEDHVGMKVAGYLNLAADFTHNFTDGLAIGILTDIIINTDQRFVKPCLIKIQ